MTIGRLTITNSIEFADQLLMSPYGGLVVILDEDMRQIMTMAASPNIICGSVILPPYSIMAQYTDNIVPPEMITQMYLQYIHTREPLGFIAAVLAYLVRKVDVCILLNSYETEFGFIPATLIEFFYMRYGITPFVDIDSRVEYEFRFDNDAMHNDFIIEDLFMFDFMKADDLLRSWSAGPLSDTVIQKLICVYNPLTSTGSFDEYRQIFTMMKDQAHTTGQLAVNPFVRGEPQ